MSNSKLRTISALIGVACGTFGNAAYAEKYCGNVSIVQMLSGPRHGSMMRVSDASCGSGGWVCLDPEAQAMSAEKSKRMYAFLLTQYSLGLPIELSIHDTTFPAACGSVYPVVSDVRTKPP